MRVFSPFIEYQRVSLGWHFHHGEIVVSLTYKPYPFSFYIENKTIRCHFQLAKLAKVVLDRIPSMKDPSTYDQTTIDCIGPLLKFLPMQSFDRIPADVFKSAYTSGKMKNMTVTTRAMVRPIYMHIYSLSYLKFVFNY